MNVCIITSDDNPATAIRGLLRRHGHDCLTPVVIARDEARSAIARCNPAPEVVFVLASQDLEGALAVLRQLRKATIATLVVVGQATEPAQILATVRAGAHDYLACDERFEESFVELLGRIRLEIVAKRGRGRVIAIASACGGCGSSTLAVNLAAEFARDHGHCGLFDLKLRGGDLATLLGVKTRTHIGDLAKVQMLEPTELEQSFVHHACGIRLLASPPLLEHVGIIEPDAVGRLLEMAAKLMPYVVVDLEDIFHREQMVAIVAADVLLMIVRLDFVSLVRARKCLLFLEREGVDLTKIQIVANRTGHSGEVPPGKAAAALSRPIPHVIPDNPKFVAAAHNLGEPLVLHAPSSNVAKAMRNLAVSLMAD